MTNFEYYRKSLEEFLSQNPEYDGGVGFLKDRTVKPCNEMHCAMCQARHNCMSRGMQFVGFLLAEPNYILTPTEKEIARNALDSGYEWMARDLNGALNFFQFKPQKLKEITAGTSWHSEQEFNHRDPILNPLFDFVRFEDSAPTKIRKLLKLEESEK